MRQGPHSVLAAAAKPGASRRGHPRPLLPLLALPLALMSGSGWCEPGEAEPAAHIRYGSENYVVQRVRQHGESADLAPRWQLSLEARPGSANGYARSVAGVGESRPWLGPTSALPGNPGQSMTLAASVSAGPWMPRVRLGVESPELRRLAPHMAGDRGPLPQPPGLTLRTADPLADLRLGALFKMKLDNQSSLSLRPRGKRWALTYQSSW